MTLDWQGPSGATASEFSVQVNMNGTAIVTSVPQITATGGNGWQATLTASEFVASAVLTVQVAVTYQQGNATYSSDLTVSVPSST